MQVPATAVFKGRSRNRSRKHHGGLHRHVNMAPTAAAGHADSPPSQRAAGTSVEAANLGLARRHDLRNLQRDPDGARTRPRAQRKARSHRDRALSGRSSVLMKNDRTVVWFGDAEPSCRRRPSHEERDQLESWSCWRTSAQALATRSRVVLAAAEGLTNSEIAQRLGVSRTTVWTWRSRFVEDRLDGWWTSLGRAGRGRSPTRRSRR